MSLFIAEWILEIFDSNRKYYPIIVKAFCLVATCLAKHQHHLHPDEFAKRLNHLKKWLHENLPPVYMDFRDGAKTPNFKAEAKEVEFDLERK